MTATTVSAVGFSPTNLIYNVNVGEEQCITLSIDSTSPAVSISDKWAENENIEWKC